MKTLLRLRLSNPSFIYTSVWSLVLALNSIQLTTNISPINSKTIFLILSNIVSFWLLFFIIHVVYSRSKNISVKSIPLDVLYMLFRFVKRLIIFWAFGMLLTIIYEGGIPLIWALRGSEKTYADFGIPTVHGLFNSIYFFCTTALFLDYVVRKNKNSFFILLIMLGWPVIVFARSVLLGTLCQMVGVYVLLFRISLKSLIKVFLFSLIIVIAFGLIGDYRGTQSNLSALVEDRYQFLFEWLPSGFLWFYVYLTSPLNNVIANIDSIQPNYVPYYSIANLIPTVARNFFYSEDFVRPDSFDLVVENLNVSTFYAGYLSDFGTIGSIIIVAMIQVFIIVVYFYAMRRAVWAIMAYAVLFQCIVFSVFYNLLSSQVYIMQILIALYFSWKVKLHYFRAKIRLGVF